MQRLGYREGQNLVIYERHADGDRARLQSLAAELVDARIEVIVAVGTDATEAARAITSSIPIVMAGVGDPFGIRFRGDFGASRREYDRDRNLGR